MFVVVEEPPPVSVELESSSFEQEIVKIVNNAKISKTMIKKYHKLEQKDPVKLDKENIKTKITIIFISTFK